MAKIIVGKTKIECRLIIFDRDGTLVDQQHFLLNLAKARFQSLSKIVGVHVAELWEKAVGTDLKHGYVDHNGPLATAPQREELLVAASVIYQCGHSWSEAKKIAQEAYDQADESLKPTYGCVLFDGVSDVLRELKSDGVKLAIATTDSHKRTEESLNSLGVAQFFDAIIGADDVENPKPAPDMVLEACKQTGCKPGGAVVVGDSSSDMMMGRNAKVKKCIAVSTGVTPKEKLQQIADIVIESVNEIKSKK